MRYERMIDNYKKSVVVDEKASSVLHSTPGRGKGCKTPQRAQ